MCLSEILSPLPHPEAPVADIPLTWLFQWLPKYVIDDDYSPQAAVAAISPIPLLLIHGKRDGIVPAHHSELLFGAAQEPKALWLIPDVGHIQALREAPVRKRLAEFMQSHCCEAPAQLTKR